VRIAVQDNGIGIAEDNLSRIFGMFAQAAVPPDRAPEGLGIGLSLVSRLLEMHGGSLSATAPASAWAAPSRSSCRCCAPRRRSAAAGEAAAAAPAPPGAGRQAPRAAGRRQYRRDGDDGLPAGRDGLRGLTTPDASQLVELALARQPDVIVLDIGLPGVDGYELARMLKRHPQLGGIRLVAHTGYGSPEDRSKARRRGSMRTWSSRRSWMTSRRRCRADRRYGGHGVPTLRRGNS
jgi:CheY-like chemotaxis protein